MVSGKHLKYRRIIESIILFFHLQDAQINKTPIECSCEHCECVFPGREYFLWHYERMNFVTKQLKLVKKIQCSNKNGYVINKY